MARKRLKRKRRSCGVCKPNKTRGGNRWTDRDEHRLREAERIALWKREPA